MAGGTAPWPQGRSDGPDTRAGGSPVPGGRRRLVHMGGRDGPVVHSARSGSGPFGGERCRVLRVTSRDEAPGEVPLEEQLALTLRAYRRARGLSQRALAEELGIPQSTIARLERRARQLPLATVLDALAATGHALRIVAADGRVVEEWEPTDHVARDRKGRRFPATRRVRPVRPGGFGPVWWEFHEYAGTGPCGPQPRWTAEGFQVSGGARLGRPPRPADPDEGPRWPHGV